MIFRKSAPPFDDAKHELNDMEEREREELSSSVAARTPPLPPSTEQELNEIFPIACDIDRVANSNTPPFPAERIMFDITVEFDWNLPELVLRSGAPWVNEDDVMFILDRMIVPVDVIAKRGCVREMHISIWKLLSETYPLLTVIPNKSEKTSSFEREASDAKILM